MSFLCVLLSQSVYDRGERTLTLSSPLPPFLSLSFFFFFVKVMTVFYISFLIVPCFFNAVTPMQSPCVLNPKMYYFSAGEKHEPLSYTTAQKHQCSKPVSDGNLTQCTSLHSANSHRYLMSALDGCFLDNL